MLSKLLSIIGERFHKESIHKQDQKNNNYGSNINPSQFIRGNEPSKRPQYRFC